MEPARHLATYADLLALPEDVRAEILAGEIVTSPSALPRHGWSQRQLSKQLGAFDDDDGPEGWWILVEADVQLGTHDIVRPDLSGWRRGRLPVPWDQRPIVTTPDWVCEILSPSNARHDRVTKLALYARSGIPFYWLLDPDARTLEAYRLEGSRWVVSGTYDDASVARVEPFETIELVVGKLFTPNAG